MYDCVKLSKSSFPLRIYLKEPPHVFRKERLHGPQKSDKKLASTSMDSPAVYHAVLVHILCTYNLAHTRTKVRVLFIFRAKIFVLCILVSEEPSISKAADSSIQSGRSDATCMEFP